MLVAKEWNQFAHKRKTLRVAYPVEKQRSTYWLQLPYTYSIPLLIMSSLLHWLVSQTLFFVQIEEVESKRVITSCGYSPIAIITVIPIGVILFLVVVLTGFRRYEKGIPLAGSSSAALSVACHPPEEDVDARLLPVMWGDVKMRIQLWATAASPALRFRHRWREMCMHVWMTLGCREDSK